MAKASELRAKDVAALKTEINDLLKSHFNMRMQRATQQFNDTSALKKTRRQIARLRTILTEKRQGATK